MLQRHGRKLGAGRLFASFAAVGALAFSSLVFPVITPVYASENVAFVAGSFQSELGCASDWEAACERTRMQGNAGQHRVEFDLPAGTWAFKVALNGTWERSFGNQGNDIPLILKSPTKVVITLDESTGKVGLALPDLENKVYTAEDDKLIQTPATHAGAGKQFYFVLTDRFNDADPSNNKGGLEGTRLEHGFDPADKAFYHGGDIKGVTQKLDYLKTMGISAVWLSPSLKNKPVQGEGDQATAGYHGYWITDFTQIDPHLGTNDDLKELIKEAHERDMKVYFDIITNHTADVVGYTQGGKDYRYIDEYPYKSAQGQVIDIAKLAGKPKSEWPELSVEVSFPYQPQWHSEAEKGSLRPEWLNDLRYYHHRGDTTWQGESVTYGDFAGLDDLLTEHPDVVDGMVDVYKKWIDAGLDGFRIDTVKHVNKEFWVQWTDEIHRYAKEKGKPDFFTFGEVYEASASALAPYVRETQMSAVLDFQFQAKVRDWVKGFGGNALAELFKSDDFYTTPTANANMLPTFLGNHDMGRIGFFVEAGKDEHAGAKAQLAHSLMYLTRGQPVVYYGDEQGFAGKGDDKDARQDMFATQTAEFLNEPKVDGGKITGQSQFDENSYMYRHVAALGKLRAEHKALHSGAQLERWKENGQGIYAFSRVDRDEQIEYLVAVNNSGAQATARPLALTKDATFTKLYPVSEGGVQTLTANDEGQVELTVPPFGAVVYQADRKVSAGELPQTKLNVAGHRLDDRAEIVANTGGALWSETSFAVREVGGENWQNLGVDTGDNATVYHDVAGTYPAGTLLEYRAVTIDAAGHKVATSGFGVVGVDLATTVDIPQIDKSMVTLPGTFNASLGCQGGVEGNWDPACEATKMDPVPGTTWYMKELTIPAGEHKYKVAVGGSWSENYGIHSKKDGEDSKFRVDKGPAKVKFYYDSKSKYFFNTYQHPEYTVPGDFGVHLGCENWKPECLATLMRQEPDGTFVFETDRLPEGDYQFKITDHLNWDEPNWGRNGDNYPLHVNPNQTVRITFKNGEINVTQTDRVLVGEKEARAQWIDQNTIAIAKSQLDGKNFADVDATLLIAETGGIKVVNDQPQNVQQIVQLKRSGLDSVQRSRWPHLGNHAIYRLPTEADLDRATVLRGSLQVMTSVDDKAIGLTRVQIPGVLDALYAERAADAKLGVSWEGNQPKLSVWAPTAKKLTLLLWDNETGTGNPTEVAMTRDGNTGIWSVTGETSWKNHAYKYRAEVFVPATDRVETNDVTDPYSTGLTTGSQHSVILNLDDPELKPSGWDTLRIPAVPRAVDQTIYELHVRDFSITDQSVPEELRGTFKAFTVGNSHGMQHLTRLANAGVNSIHLLPTYDIATIPEPRSAQIKPDIEEITDPASTQPQEAIAKVAGQDGFNWGYDPYHYMAPEGSYAVDSSAAGRVREYREMVAALANTGDNGLRVVADQVFNHLAESGQSEKVVFDRLVPGYYHRLNEDGKVENSTCCENLATEHSMMEKLMVDTVKMWARNYKVSGFRFDLMGHHSADNMRAVKAGLASLTVEKDGINGSNIHIYGEGWNFGEISNNSRFIQATQGQLDGTEVGTFNDRLRDGVMGGHHNGFDTSQGFASGQFTNPNTPTGNNSDYWALSRNTDLVRLGMAGNLREYGWETTDGYRQGKEIYQGGRAAGYAGEPSENVNYVDAHDNSTLYDLAVAKLPVNTSMEDRVRYNTLQLAPVALGQSPAFWHGGTDLMRSKSLDRDSYNAGDHFNAIDWSRQKHNFGVGLPSYEKNEKENHNWDKMRPLLQNRALVASPADLDKAHFMALDLLKLRHNTQLMRLGSTALIKQKVKFPNQGAHTYGGLIAMHIDDTVGDDVDKKLDHVLVVLNADTKEAKWTYPSLKGIDFELNEIQKESNADERVKGTQWDATNGSISVPPLTVAVLYAKQQTQAEKHQPVYADQSVTRGVYSEPLNDTEIAEGTTTAAGSAGMAPTAATQTPALPAGVVYAAGENAPTWVRVNPETGVIIAFPGAEVEVGEVSVNVLVTYPDKTSETIVAKLLVNDNQASVVNPQYQPVTAVIGKVLKVAPTLAAQIPANTVVSATITTEIPGLTVTVDAATGELMVTATEPGVDLQGNGEAKTTTVLVTWKFPDGSHTSQEMIVTVPAKQSTPDTNPDNGGSEGGSTGGSEGGSGTENPAPGGTETPNPPAVKKQNETYPVNYPQENAEGGKTPTIIQKLRAGDAWILKRIPGLLPVGTKVALGASSDIKENWTVTIAGSDAPAGVQPNLIRRGFAFRLATVEANDSDFGAVTVTVPKAAPNGETSTFEVVYTYPDGSEDVTKVTVSAVKDDSTGEGDGGNTGDGQPTPPGTGDEGGNLEPNPGDDSQPRLPESPAPGKPSDSPTLKPDQSGNKEITQPKKPDLPKTGGNGLVGFLLASLTLGVAGLLMRKQSKTPTN